MASTSIPAVKAAIQEILAEAGGLDGILVTTDYNKTDRAPEHIWIWKAKSKRDFKGLGHRPPRLQEEIKVTLRVVTVGGADAAAAEARVYEIVEAAETALREDTTLGGVARKAHVADLDEEPLSFDSKIGCHVLMTVAAETVI